MKFYSVRDLRTNTRELWQTLSDDEEVILTNNGKPSALILDLNEDNFEEMLTIVRSLKASLALSKMRKEAEQAGFLSDEEIEAEIQMARAERKSRNGAEQ